MTTTATTPDPQLIEELADEYAALAADIEPKQARLDEIKKHFRGLPRGTHDIAGLAITVSRNSRLDTKALTAAYPAADHPGLYESKLSTTRAREALGEDMIEDFTSEGDPKVSVKLT